LVVIEALAGVAGGILFSFFVFFSALCVTCLARSFSLRRMQHLVCPAKRCRLLRLSLAGFFSLFFGVFFSYFFYEETSNGDKQRNNNVFFIIIIIIIRILQAHSTSI
jgi:hypothetical protein